MRLALAQAELAYQADEVPVGAVLVSPTGEILAAAHNRTEAAGDPTAHAELLCIRQAAAAAGGWRLLEATLYVTLEPCPMCAGALLQVSWQPEAVWSGGALGWLGGFPGLEWSTHARCTALILQWLGVRLVIKMLPCLRHTSACLLQSRVGTVVYGARNRLLGADGSWIAMLPEQQQPLSEVSSCSCSQESGSSSKHLSSDQEEASSSGGSSAAPAAARPAAPHPFHPNMAVRRGVLAAECGQLMKSFFARRRKEQAAAAAAGVAQGTAAGSSTDGQQ